MKTFTRKEYWTWLCCAVLCYGAGVGFAMLGAPDIIALAFLFATVPIVIIAIIRRVRVIGYGWALLLFIPFGALILGAVADPKEKEDGGPLQVEI